MTGAAEVNAMFRIASEAHKGQFRKWPADQPFVFHPIRVAMTAGRFANSEGRDVCTAVALGHDLLEDTAVTADWLRTYGISERVVRDIERLTQWWEDDADNETKAAGKPVYYANILESPSATLIKILDRADNLLDMIQMVDAGRGVKWAKRYLQKTENEIYPLLQHSISQKAVEYFQEIEDSLRERLEHGYLANPSR